MAIDPKILEILGVSPQKSKRSPAPIAPPPVNQSKIAANLGYQKLRLPQLAKSDNAVSLDFHTRAVAIIQEECAAAVAAIAKIDDTLMPSIRTARVAGLARLTAAAIQTRLANAAVPLARVIYDARAIVDAAMNRQPADPAAASLWFAKVADMRRQMEGLTLENVVKAAIALSRRGDETFPAVFLDSLSINLPDGMIAQFTQDYQKAAAGPAVATLEDAQDALAEVKAIIQCAELAIGAAFNQLGITPDQWNKVSLTDIVQAWPKATKANFINACGEDAYMGLLQGHQSFESVLGFFRPGLTETSGS